MPSFYHLGQGPVGDVLFLCLTAVVLPEVELRLLSQWFMRITAHADRLLEAMS